MKKLLLISLIFLFSCQSEYVKFHQEKSSQDEVSSKTQEFSLDKVWYLSWISLKQTPDLKLLDELNEKISNAKSRVYVEVYIFTEKRLKKSLIDAKKRWLDVKVVLEKNIYLAWNINAQTFKDLEKNKIEVVYSNSKNYALNHSKMMIIDDEVVISTGNYSYSTFKYNREFFLFINNSDMLGVFLDIFNNDFLWIKKNIYQDNLILSPFSSRIKLETLLNYATKSIKIYSHNFSDENIINKLIEKNNSKIDVKIIFPDLKKVSSNKEEIQILKNNNISYKLIDKPEMHAKSILVDDKYLYIWSVNFSPSSIDQNREIWIILNDENIIKEFDKVFNDDFNK